MKRHVTCFVEKALFEPRTLGTKVERYDHCATRPVLVKMISSGAWIHIEVQALDTGTCAVTQTLSSFCKARDGGLEQTSISKLHLGYRSIWRTFYIMYKNFNMKVCGFEIRYWRVGFKSWRHFLKADCLPLLSLSIKLVCVCVLASISKFLKNLWYHVHNFDIKVS
jgi:hypothetical protein